MHIGTKYCCEVVTHYNVEYIQQQRNCQQWVFKLKIEASYRMPWSNI
jgi:hypothetical protein